MAGLTTALADVEFQPFGKIPRLSRDCIVTEKIDGTNAQVCIRELEGCEAEGAVYQSDGLALYSGSRRRWITPEHDNFGFAAWYRDHGEELLGLGPGRHFGEWWGAGIQRGYGQTDKHFSLFNTTRWCLHGQKPERIVTADPRLGRYKEPLPACCELVPVLWRGEFNTDAVWSCLDDLEAHGSVAVPGYMNPEGIVVFHVAGGVMFKKTLVGDEMPKGATA